MVTNFCIERFDLLAYELSLFRIDTYADPDYPDEGSMTIRVEGAIGGPSRRLELINGVVPHARQRTTNLIIGADEMPEDGSTIVTPRIQSIPANHKFVLVWESKTPYFTGVETGAKYRL